MPRQILVDDEQDILDMLNLALELGGYRVRTAGSGAEALRQLRQDGDVGVILLDMMMPGRSGSDVLRALRADPATAAPPVIMLTARAQSSDRDAVNLAGANHYLTKPFSPIGLAALVAEVLAS